MCIADVWDALTAQDRPYKPPTPEDKACMILENGAKEGEFDKDVVEFQNLLGQTGVPPIIS